MNARGSPARRPRLISMRPAALPTGGPRAGTSSLLFGEPTGCTLTWLATSGMAGTGVASSWSAGSDDPAIGAEEGDGGGSGAIAGLLRSFTGEDATTAACDGADTGGNGQGVGMC